MKISVNHRGQYGWCASAKDEVGGIVEGTAEHDTREAAIQRLAEKIQKRVDSARKQLEWYEQAMAAMREVQKGE